MSKNHRTWTSHARLHPSHRAHRHEDIASCTKNETRSSKSENKNMNKQNTEIEHIILIKTHIITDLSVIWKVLFFLLAGSAGFQDHSGPSGQTPGFSFRPLEPPRGSWTACPASKRRCGSGTEGPKNRGLRAPVGGEFGCSSCWESWCFGRTMPRRGRKLRVWSFRTACADRFLYE